MKRRSLFFWLATFLFLTFSHLPPDSVFAATFTVNSAADDVDANPGDGVCSTAGGLCTLRAAITEANSLAGADTITLPAGTYRLTIAGQDEDMSATGDLDIREALTINGEGSAITLIDGNNLDRVFDIHSGAITISGVTIRGGNPGAGRPGGGIMVSTSVAGPLTIINSTITGNRAANGGGIYNPGLGLTLTNSAVDNNLADVDGGGITNVGFLVMQNSTISINTATSEAGLSHIGTNAASIINSTVSGNIATTGSAGGLFVDTIGALSIMNTTIFNNKAELSGGGLVVFGTGPVTVRNTIIANNLGGNCIGISTSAGHNLDSGNSCGFSDPTDFINTNPLLGPLSNNGGPTMTHALLSGSPAIDAADPMTFPATDQRGVTRPQGLGPDIGAYELKPSAATQVSVPTMTEWGLAIFTVLAGILSVNYLRNNRKKLANE